MTQPAPGMLAKVVEALSKKGARWLIVSVVGGLVLLAGIAASTGGGFDFLGLTFDASSDEVAALQLEVASLSTKVETLEDRLAAESAARKEADARAAGANEALLQVTARCGACP